MHSMLTRRFGHEIQPWLNMNEMIITEKNTNPSDSYKGVPENPALECLPKAIFKAHQRYVERFLPSVHIGSAESINQGHEPVVLFIVQEGETNTVDQRLLEFHLFQNHGLSVIRMSLNQVFNRVTMNKETGALFVNEEGQEREVSIVYFRAGYAPTDYPDGLDGKEWKAREKLERSRATKCPCLGYHLAGTKKVQQSVARPGVLERFFDINDPSEQEMIQSMRKSFAGLFSLGEDTTQEDLNVVKDILLLGHEGSYVLKPQREGGGSNYYGHNLAEKLKENVQVSEDGSSISLDKNLAEFILMERLFPPSQDAILIRGGLVEGIGKTISELGCFGSILVSHDGAKTVHNEYAGFLLRTKFNGVDEGGVASGFATLSSPYLC
jgi:glutathione synthetase